VLYNNLSTYLKNRYGTRLKKICIDGGFTCPNRDGTSGRGGCIFCSERGSGEHITERENITEQVKAALKGAKDTDKFIAYFQNFTNTYAPCDILRERYDAALIDERIKILAIGTRPDCITREIAALIASYTDRVDVWVELGLQTASDKTAAIINRGYKTDVYERACEILHSHGIPIVTHIMIGLPGESDEELYKTVELIRKTKPFGIKIHSVYVVRGTALSAMLERGEYVPISKEDYVRRATYVLTHVSPDTVIHRLTGDCPRELLVAPTWNTDKNAILGAIQNGLDQNGLYQGIYYTPKTE
jgi:radical SAM protein (TIGR01212 family)